MAEIRWFYAPEYDYTRGIPGEPDEVHGFVLNKPTRIRDELLARGTALATSFTRPHAATEPEFQAVHEPHVLDDLHDPEAVARAIEFPAIAQLPPDSIWLAVVAPQLHAAGGTRAALRAAADGVWALNLSGGYHHARPDLSHGFCLVNDVALAVSSLRRSGVGRRILILDLDLHQGDGNAVFFSQDEDVFTFSMHEDAIFPWPKARSDLDVGLPSHVGDEVYLARLDESFPRIRERFSPEILVYVAGSDPFTDDPLGTLRLSADAMAERDRRVACFATELGCGLVAVTAGGYSAQSPTLTAAGFAEIARLGREGRGDSQANRE